MQQEQLLALQPMALESAYQQLMAFSFQLAASYPNQNLANQLRALVLEPLGQELEFVQREVLVAPQV
jgi:hypothetical protein